MVNFSCNWRWAWEEAQVSIIELSSIFLLAIYNKAPFFLLRPIAMCVETELSEEPGSALFFSFPLRKKKERWGWGKTRGGGGVCKFTFAPARWRGRSICTWEKDRSLVLKQNHGWPFSNIDASANGCTALISFHILVKRTVPIKASKT